MKRLWWSIPNEGGMEWLVLMGEEDMGIGFVIFPFMVLSKMSFFCCWLEIKGIGFMVEPLAVLLLFSSIADRFERIGGGCCCCCC